MTKLIFHLGDMKTGSTAIQTALASKAWVCDTVSLLYPHGNRVSHITLARSLSGKGEAANTEKLVGDILLEINATPTDIAIISAEDFEVVDPQILKAAIEKYMPQYLPDARFLSYVRPHADRFASSYAERVKTGWFAGTLTEMQAQIHKRGNFVYTPRFLAWRATFGDAFTLRPMIRDLLYRQDVVADFLKFVFQSEDFTLTSTPDANESLSLENLSIVRQMHLRLGTGQTKFQNYQATIGRALARRMNDSAYRQGTKVRIHKALAEVVRDQYAADAAALDAAFFTGTPMTDALNAAPDKAVAVEQSVRIEDHFSDREQYLINTLVDQTCVLIKADPDFLAEMLRGEHRGNVIAPDDTPDGETPRRRRAGKGRKGAGAQAAKAERLQGGAKGRAGGGRKAGVAKRAIAAAQGTPETATPALRKTGAGKGRLGGGRKTGAGRAKPAEPATE